MIFCTPSFLLYGHWQLAKLYCHSLFLQPSSPPPPPHEMEMKIMIIIIMITKLTHQERFPLRETY